ncbi:MAG: DsbA family protein [Paracoccaceae bacterium]
MKRLIITLGMVFALLAPAVQADELTRDDIKELVLEAIRENPEIIMEAVQLLQQREQQAEDERASQALADLRPTLEGDPNAPVLGNPNGDVTVVEFFDYNCPYCRRAKPAVEALLANDPNVRLVYREWPILGEGSVFAARAALASRKQGKYEEFHWAMMGMQGRAEESSVLRIAESIGLDIEQMREDMQDPAIDEHFATSVRLTESLGFSGTPSFVIGDALVPGLVSEEVLMETVANARATGK